MRFLSPLVMYGYCASILMDPLAAQACSCREFTKEEAYQDADVVFLGTVEQFEANKHPSVWNFTGRTAQFRVEKVWKGTVKPLLKVRTGFGGGDCGYDFEVGKPYLVFAQGSKPPYYTGMCSGTAPAEHGGRELENLGNRRGDD